VISSSHGTPLFMMQSSQRGGAQQRQIIGATLRQSWTFSLQNFELHKPLFLPKVPSLSMSLKRQKMGLW
jgi:hypothetical protein